MNESKKGEINEEDGRIDEMNLPIGEYTTRFKFIISNGKKWTR